MCLRVVLQVPSKQPHSFVSRFAIQERLWGGSVVSLGILLHESAGDIVLPLGDVEALVLICILALMLTRRHVTVFQGLSRIYKTILGHLIARIGSTLWMFEGITSLNQAF